MSEQIKPKLFVCVSFSVLDVDCTQKMSELTKRKDELTTVVKSYTETFNMHKELLQMMTCKSLLCFFVCSLGL